MKASGYHDYSGDSKTKTIVLKNISSKPETVSYKHDISLDISMFNLCRFFR